MNQDQIETKQSSISGKTADALKNVLELASIAIDNGPHIYLPHKRENGVYWVAVGKYMGETIAIHGMSIAGDSVRNGMVITRHSGTLWQAVANKQRTRGKVARANYGNALEWPAEPMIDRLARCLEAFYGHDLLSDAATDKLRKKLTAMKEGRE